MSKRFLLLKQISVGLLLMLPLLVSNTVSAGQEPLPSWEHKSAASRRAVTEFVQEISNIRSEQYVAPKDRVAVLGFNGTLVGIDSHSESSDITYRGLTYQPMYELVKYLQDNSFTCWIVSSSGKQLLQQQAPIYGISPEHLISNVALERKAKAIEQKIAVRPIFAAGSSVNDYEMLRYSRQQPQRTLQLLLQHDDSVREADFASRVKEDVARIEQWRLVSIKNDWRDVFNRADLKERIARVGRQSAMLPRISAKDRPTIDGRITESVYQNLPWKGSFVEMRAGSSSLLEAQTKVFAAYDDENLYVAFRCEEPEMESMSVVGSQRNDEVYNGETVEISILKPGEVAEEDNASFYHFILNPDNIIFDHIANEKGSTPADFNPPIETATAKQSESWTAEAAIPWKELGITARPGLKIHANFARSRRNGSKRELSSWSQFIAGFLETDRFGTLTLGN